MARLAIGAGGKSMSLGTGTDTAPGAAVQCRCRAGAVQCSAVQDGAVQCRMEQMYPWAQGPQHTIQAAAIQNTGHV